MQTDKFVFSRLFSGLVGHTCNVNGLNIEELRYARKEDTHMPCVQMYNALV